MREKTKAILTERLPFYLVGLAIGFVMLGFFNRMRQRALQPSQPQNAAETDQQPAAPNTPADAPAPATGDVPGGPSDR
ncbi:MAG: hypothetical protein AAF108_10720 [Planctomycetota bacterium]